MLYYVHNQLNKQTIHFASCLMVENTSFADRFVRGALRSTPFSVIVHN